MVIEHATICIDYLGNMSNHIHAYFTLKIMTFKKQSNFET